jgi:hypothetical protein
MNLSHEPPLPNDVVWCYNNIATLDALAFAKQFGFLEKPAATVRYANIIKTYFQGKVKTRLRHEYEALKGTEIWNNFWRQRTRTKTAAASAEYVNDVTGQEVNSLRHGAMINARYLNDTNQQQYLST